MEALTVFGTWEVVKTETKEEAKKKKEQMSFNFVPETQVKTVTGKIVTQKSIF